MTANQIAYNRMLEESRTHRVQEEETHRANVVKEQEQNRANTLNYQASIYATDAAMRNAQLNADTQRYVAGLNYASSVYATDVNAANQRYNTDQNVQQRNREMWMNYTLNNRSFAETERHNVAMEKAQSDANENTRYRTGVDFLNSIAKFVGIGMSAA